MLKVNNKYTQITAANILLRIMSTWTYSLYHEYNIKTQ